MSKNEFPVLPTHIGNEVSSICVVMSSDFENGIVTGERSKGCQRLLHIGFTVFKCNGAQAINGFFGGVLCRD
jgi:hypothetical protein